MAEGGLSGTALAIAAAGGVLIWSGIQNRTIVESIKSLAMGKPIEPGDQKKSEINFGGGGSFGSASEWGNFAGSTAKGAAVVSLAATYRGTQYVFGGGHGAKPCAKMMDCSGYVSCVLSKLGMLKGGPLTTEGLARWGSGVPFSKRAPGDVLVWRGGPGGGHTGIVINATTMWHNPCTLCGGVQIGKYGSTKGGRTTLVRRGA